MALTAPSSLIASEPLSRNECVLVAIAVINMAWPTVVPVMINVLAGQMGYGVARAGYVASLNNMGVLSGALLAAFVGARMPAKTRILAGLTMMVIGHLVSIVPMDYKLLLAIRAFSGFGEGITAGTCYLLFARSRNASRMIAFYAAGQGGVGAIGLAILPSLTIALGWQALFLSLAIFTIPAFYLLSRFTPADDVQQGKATGKLVPNKAALATLAAIFLLWVGCGSIWAFMQTIAVSRHYPLALMSLALSLSAIGAIIGALTVGLWAYRLQISTALWIGSAIVILAAAGIGVGNYVSFTLSIMALRIMWAFIYPFYFRLLALSDMTGRAGAYTSVITGSGLATATAIGGLIFERGGIAPLIALNCVASLAAMVLVALISRHVNRRAEI